jgi:hypothetical protein
MTTLLVLLGFALAVAASVRWAVTLRVSKSVSGFVPFSANTSYTDTSGVLANPKSVPAAQPGILTTHTTNTTGTLTMTNLGHGITTGQRIDIFWATGQCYGAVAGTVSGTTVPIASVSGGSNLPANGTPVTVGIPTAAAFDAVGNNVAALVCSLPTADGYFVFNTGSADIVGLFVQNGLFVWTSDEPTTNPLAGATSTTVYCSHNNVAAALTNQQAAAVTH